MPVLPHFFGLIQSTNRVKKKWVYLITLRFRVEKNETKKKDKRTATTNHSSSSTNKVAKTFNFSADTSSTLGSSLKVEKST